MKRVVKLKAGNEEIQVKINMDIATVKDAFLTENEVLRKVDSLTDRIVEQVLLPDFHFREIKKS